MATRSLVLVQDNAIYFYSHDFIKNVTEVFDAQGTIAAAYDYSPYGTATRTGRLVQPVQWSGEMHDEEPALAYYNYRFYNPKDGRWINRDPSLNREDGIFMRSSVTEFIYMTHLENLSISSLVALFLLLLKLLFKL